MSEPLGVSELGVADLLARISAAAVAPGAGTAGAVALALAAACAGKAVSVSLKHQPADRQLLSAQTAFHGIVRAALAEGDRDAAAFKTFIEGKDAAAVSRLVREGEEFGHLIAKLLATIDEVVTRVLPNMAGDIVAARALAAAARTIQERNEQEAAHARR